MEQEEEVETEEGGGNTCVVWREVGVSKVKSAVGGEEEEQKKVYRWLSESLFG